MYEIEDDVPLPPIQATRERKYRFAEMRIGQSFFVPNAKRSSLSNGMNFWSKKTGFKFTARKLTEDGVAGVRVWRFE